MLTLLSVEKQMAECNLQADGAKFHGSATTNLFLQRLKIGSVMVPYCYLFLLSVFILWFSCYVSDIFCKF